MGLGMMGTGGDQFESDGDGRGWVSVSVPVQTSTSNSYNTILSTSADCKNFFDLILNFLIVQNRFNEVGNWFQILLALY